MLETLYLTIFYQHVLCLILVGLLFRKGKLFQGQLNPRSGVWGAWLPIWRGRLHALKDHLPGPSWFPSWEPVCILVRVHLAARNCVAVTKWPQPEGH